MPESPNSAEIDRAASLLRAGRLVAFPTETVYGLGANALDAEAVARIYAVKRRPATSPLIVHVASIAMAKSLVAAWPETAERLARRFWPGPLTLVLPSAGAIPPVVTAGLPNVALRMPGHPVALALIGATGVPLAAPSANRFTELSPTTAEHVRQSLGIGLDSEVELVLDSGPCQVGIESTVLSLAGPVPVLLRPGGISRHDLESVIGKIIGPIDAADAKNADGPSTLAHPSPGMHARHYSPHTSLLLVLNGNLPDHGKGIYLQHTHPAILTGQMLMARETTADSAAPPRITTIQMPTSAAEYAAALYDKLHQADEAHADWIAVDPPPTTPEWEAVNDRLRRAATRE